MPAEPVLPQLLVSSKLVKAHSLEGRVQDLEDMYQQVVLQSVWVYSKLPHSW